MPRPAHASADPSASIELTDHPVRVRARAVVVPASAQRPGERGSERGIEAAPPCRCRQRRARRAARTGDGGRDSDGGCPRSLHAPHQRVRGRDLAGASRSSTRSGCRGRTTTGSAAIRELLSDGRERPVRREISRGRRAAVRTLAARWLTPREQPRSTPGWNARPRRSPIRWDSPSGWSWTRPGSACRCTPIRVRATARFVSRTPWWNDSAAMRSELPSQGPVTRPRRDRPLRRRAARAQALLPPRVGPTRRHRLAARGPGGSRAVQSRMGSRGSGARRRAGRMGEVGLSRHDALPGLRPLPRRVLADDRRSADDSSRIGCPATSSAHGRPGRAWAAGAALYFVAR